MIFNNQISLHNINSSKSCSYSNISQNNYDKIKREIWPRVISEDKEHKVSVGRPSSAKINIKNIKTI